MKLRAWFLVGLCMWLAMGSSCVHQSESAAPASALVVKPAPSNPTVVGRVTSVDLPKLVSLQQEGRVLLYDVRPAFYHAMGHIPGSLNWPKAAFDAQRLSREQEIRAARDANKIVVLYCTDSACPDARAVAERLSMRGHDVCVLDGGWELWKSTGISTR